MVDKIDAGGNVREERPSQRVNRCLNQRPSDPLLTRPGLELCLTETERFEIFSDEGGGV